MMSKLDCIECGALIYTRNSVVHPEYPGDRLCHDCTPVIYAEYRDAAIAEYDRVVLEIIKDKSS